MDLTYMVRGADGKEYGPVSLEQLSGWIRDNRLRSEQEVKRSDMQHWAAAKAFEELSAMFAPSAPSSSALPTIGPTATGEVKPEAAASIGQMKSGASWFYWVAVLSLVNTVTAFAGKPIRFIIGLGITQIIDEFSGSLSTNGKGVALILDLLAAGVLVLFGVFANKGHSWAFLVGMILLALDGVIFLLVQDWLGVGFHAFILFCLFRGFMACRTLKAPART
jgi:GYF domain 2